MGKNLWVYLLISLFCIACSTENGERESDAYRFISGLGDAPLSNPISCESEWGRGVC